jgi:hypothetical protein
MVPIQVMHHQHGYLRLQDRKALLSRVTQLTGLFKLHGNETALRTHCAPWTRHHHNSASHVIKLHEQHPAADLMSCYWCTRWEMQVQRKHVGTLRLHKREMRENQSKPYLAPWTPLVSGFRGLTFLGSRFSFKQASNQASTRVQLSDRCFP